MLHGKRIFIVEDDPINMAIMATLLRQAGAVVSQDPWGFDTINRLISMLPVDVILLDLMLRSGVSGYDIYDKIKTHDELAHIPVIVVSAADASTEMNRARQKGFSGYIEKPFEHQSFLKSIETILDGVPVWGE